MATVGMLTSSSKPDIMFVIDAILYPSDKNFGGCVDIMLLSFFCIMSLMILPLMFVDDEVCSIS